MIQCLFGIIASIGKINFRNLSRHTDLSEKTFSRQFNKDFDFVSFNRIAIDEVMKGSAERLLIYDQSHIEKSGKKTYGLGTFWNGKRGAAEKGLEVSLLSLANAETKESMALAVAQTPAQDDIKKELNNDKANRGDWYRHFAKKHFESLPPDVLYFVADALHANVKSVESVVESRLHMVSRLRVDANLKYLYIGQQKGRGRPKQFDGKVDFKNLDRFDFVENIDNKTQLYTAVVYGVSLKRKIRLALLVHRDNDKVNFVPLFSTDVNLSAQKIVKFYSIRFQIEFIFRDAKQFTGLVDCQARSRKALDFHFNASFAAVNLAKIKHHQLYLYSAKIPFSMFSWKLRMHNENLLNLFFAKLDVPPTCKKSDPLFQDLLNFGVIQS